MNRPGFAGGSGRDYGGEVWAEPDGLAMYAAAQPSPQAEHIGVRDNDRDVGLGAVLLYPRRIDLRLSSNELDRQAGQHLRQTFVRQAAGGHYGP